MYAEVYLPHACIRIHFVNLRLQSNNINSFHMLKPSKHSYLYPWHYDALLPYYTIH